MIALKPRYDGLAEWYDEVMRDPGNRGLLTTRPTRRSPSSWGWEPAPS